MTDTRLIPITREQRDLLSGAFHDPDAAWNALLGAIDAWDAACEPVTRRRCDTHDAEAFGANRCWKYLYLDASGDADCRFVEEWCVPKPEAAA